MPDGKSQDPGRLLRSIASLHCKGSRRAIGVDLASPGEWQFCGPTIVGYARRFPRDLIFLFHHEESAAEFGSICPELRDRVVHVPFRYVAWPCFRRLDLYITTEQFCPGPPTVYTLTLFHGQGAKGVAFRLPGFDSPRANDAMFMYGPYMRQALQDHLEVWKETLPPHLTLLDIGYPKSDDLINGRLDGRRLLEEHGLDPAKKTILYAPAFNEGASLRENGLEIIETLCGLKQFNILAKLAIDCLRPTTDFAATGGINWFETVGRLERTHANFRLVRNPQADPAMAAADVMITCVSSISFEFLALGRPVIFVDTPRFFSSTLRAMFPEHDTTTWVNRTSVNGGREFGLVVARPSGLPGAVAEVLAHPESYPRRRAELLSYLLYNPGQGTAAAVEALAELRERRPRSRRPGDQGYALLKRHSGHRPLRSLIARRFRRLWTAS